MSSNIWARNETIHSIHNTPFLNTNRAPFFRFFQETTTSKYFISFHDLLSLIHISRELATVIIGRNSQFNATWTITVDAPVLLTPPRTLITIWSSLRNEPQFTSWRCIANLRLSLHEWGQTRLLVRFDRSAKVDHKKQGHTNPRPTRLPARLQRRWWELAAVLKLTSNARVNKIKTLLNPSAAPFLQ